MLRSSVLSAAGLASLASAASGPYTIRYYGVPPSGGGAYCVTSFSCKNVPQLDCCESPPNRASFPHVVVTSSGPAGVVTFHETDSGGGCLGCSNTGAINKCISNVPFEPVTVLNPSSVQCITDYNGFPSKRDDAAESKMPIKEGTRSNATKVCHQPNTVGVGSYDYVLQGSINQTFVDDLLSMTSADSIQKYDLVKDEDEDENETAIHRRAECIA